jgi:hypothetical protein
MKLSDVKWWHWTLATVALAAVIRVATGGPLPFVGQVQAPGQAAGAAPAAKLDRPARKPNTGPSLIDTVQMEGVKIGSAVPELNRLIIEAAIPNPDPQTATSPGLADETGNLVIQIAKALQTGVAENSTAVETVRIIVATKAVDRTGRDVAHLSLYSLTYNASDLYKLKAAASPAEALSLSTNIIFNVVDGREAMKAWCGAGDHVNQATQFCGLVTATKGV